MSLKLNFPTLDFLIILTRSRVGIKKKGFCHFVPYFYIHTLPITAVYAQYKIEFQNTLGLE